MSEFLFDAPADEIRPQAEAPFGPNDDEVVQEDVEIVEPAQAEQAPEEAAEPHITIEQLSSDLGTTPEILRGFGLDDCASGVRIPYHRDDGECFSRVVSGSIKEEVSVWDRHRPPCPYGLRELHRREDSPLILTPHEAESWPLWLHGFQALALPGVSAVRSMNLSILECVERVYVVQPAHHYGKRFVDLLARQLHSIDYRGDAFILPLQENEPDLWTLHLSAQGQFAERFGELRQRRQLLERERVLGILASDVVPEKVEWLWPGWIPLRKVTVADGDPGLGKSTIFEADIAARVSTGT